MTDQTYDPQADAAYLRLAKGDVVESAEVSPGVVLDYDAEGRILGIEIIGASKVVAPGDWSKARLPGSQPHAAE
ncbi:DUF2283 domain-containing protein [Caulobacter sp. NIBR2454]|uniref:DUF2283 domain-containing protein n=1 Tax=Caulobacter sp. NIBR2454 TaxID=3015996 RepID=UPI0022B659CD|nr:DUF2283 domain-containing protein [Caulobacter sp. NIBR2454]